MAYRIYKHYDGWSFSVNHATAGMKWVHYVWALELNLTQVYIISSTSGLDES